MSKPRYNWWPFALNMIKDYPTRNAEYNELHKQKITASMTGLSSQRSASRTTENIAIRLLPRHDQLEYDAVRKAIALTQMDESGDLQLEVVKLTLWKNSHSIDGAAIKLHISPRTAKRYRWKFILCVGYTYGLLTPEEYEFLKRKEQGIIQ